MFEKIYRLCNEKEYFTCGSSTQYNLMFDMARERKPAHDIALVIWICSDNADLSVIEQEINEIYKEVCGNSEIQSLPDDVIS